ncbi:MAG: MT-A70 family methyltransferase [Desulfatirhabdiaceae bacterium]
MSDCYKINEKFKCLIPPLSDSEYQLLEENILKDGCRDPLVIWSGTIIDGHNRYAICTKHGLPFKTTPLDFNSDEDAEDWIDKNQLGRRNLNPDQMSLLRGRRYNRLKNAQGGDHKSKDQNDTLINSAESLSNQHGVSPATIKRDGLFACAVETVKKIEPDIERRVIKNEAPPKKEIIKAAKLMEDHPEMATAIIRGEKKTSDVIREIRRAEIVTKLEDIKVKEVKAASGVYDVIVIDPPWPMQKIERDVRPNQSGLDYPTMSEEELSKLEIPCADDCHVWVWTTQKFLPMALSLLSKWSLKYVCTFVWHKPGGFQPIGLPQFNCEFCIYARKGTPQFIDTRAFMTCFEAPRGEHSEKPGAFYDVVRRVTAGRRLDMFNRREIAAFDSWGQEANGERLSA